MQNQMMNMLMNQLKARNPQIFQFLKQAQKNQSNPKELFKEITKDYNSEQMENIFNQAKQFGIDDETINQLK